MQSQGQYPRQQGKAPMQMYQPQGYPMQFMGYQQVPQIQFVQSYPYTYVQG